MNIHRMIALFRRDRKHISGLMTLSAFAASGSAYLWLHYTGSAHVSKFLQLYRNGQPVPLSDELFNLCQSCLREAKIDPSDSEKLQFFASSTDEPTFWGYLTMRRHRANVNAWIGLPYYFEFKSRSDIDTDKLSVWVDDAVPWQTKNGQRLLDSLVLSENAKKFVVMRQIYMTNTMAAHLNFANIVACLTIHWLISSGLFKAFEKTPYASIPLGLRVMMKLVQLALCATLFVSVRDIIRHACETQSDLRAVEHGDDYYEGAIEFYSKLLNRNKAFSFFLGDEGKHYFTSSGDPKPPLYFKYFKPTGLVPSARIAAIQDRFGHYIAKDEPISN